MVTTEGRVPRDRTRLITQLVRRPRPSQNKLEMQGDTRFAHARSAAGGRVSSQAVSARELRRAKKRVTIFRSREARSAGAPMNGKASPPRPAGAAAEHREATRPTVRTPATRRVPAPARSYLTDREKAYWESRSCFVPERMPAGQQLRPDVESARFTAWRIALCSATSSTVFEPVAH